MKLNNFLDKYGESMNPLETEFITNIYYKDYGETGLDLIKPQVELEREDGTNKLFYIDFVIKTKRYSYAIETHGYHAHAEGGKFVGIGSSKFDDLQTKNNLINEKYDKYLELSRNQVKDVNDAIFAMRRLCKSDKQLFNLYLHRDSDVIKPSDVQSLALDKMCESRKKGHASGLVVFATALGKTFLSGFDIKNVKAKKVLFIAHVAEILRKTKNDFEDLMKDRIDDMFIFNSNSVPNNDDIVFATIQSIHKKKNLEIFKRDYFDYIVIDEAHHSAAPTYKKVLEYFEPKFLLGLTATPYRGDDQEILKYYGNNIIFQMDQEQASNEGYLADIKYIGHYDDIDYSDIRWNGSKYDLEDLNKKLMIEERDKSILNIYNEKAKKSKTIGFCTSIEHANYMADLFNKEGISAIAIHSKSESTKSILSTNDRDTLLDDFRKDKYQVAFTVNMFNEGVDVPDISTILMLRPTDSLGIFVQQIGRGLRISDGKDYLTVLDFVGNYRTADVTLEGLGLTLEDLKFDKEKGIYFYDNKGKHVEFHEEVVEIFKAIISRSSKDVDLDSISKRWKEYGEFLDVSTRTDSKNKNSVTQYWQVDKKKKDLRAHIIAIEFVEQNRDKYKDFSSLDVALKEKLRKDGYEVEGTRALFFSKLLGLITNDSPFAVTEVFRKINGEESNDREVLSEQMEKLYFWNDIYSKTNRHSTKSTLTQKDELFSIYTIFFIYQLLIKLIDFNGDKYLTKFELQYFVFFARTHDDLEDIFQHILEYRGSDNKYELEKYLKLSVRSDKQNEKYNIFDSRYYSILHYCTLFKCNEDKIELRDGSLNSLYEKVSSFEDLLKNKNISNFTSYEKYRELLYDNRSLLEHFKSN